MIDTDTKASIDFMNAAEVIGENSSSDCKS